MPLAALFVVQGGPQVRQHRRHEVSMPLAALFVVQVQIMIGSIMLPISFNAARGFVCGASGKGLLVTIWANSFNAARGFVCGARTAYHSYG